MFAAVGLSRLVRRGQQLDADYARGEADPHDDRAGGDRPRAGARADARRARADSISKLAEEERRIGEEHRRALAGRETKTRDELAAALSAAQQQVERRFVEWSQDLERIQEQLATQIARIPVTQRELIAQVEARPRTPSGSRRRARSSARQLLDCAGARALDRGGRAGGERRARVAGGRSAPRAPRGRGPSPPTRGSAARADRARGDGGGAADRRRLLGDRATSGRTAPARDRPRDVGFSELATQQFDDEIRARRKTPRGVRASSSARLRRSSATRAACSPTSSRRSRTRAASASRSGSARSPPGSSASATTRWRRSSGASPRSRPRAARACSRSSPRSTRSAP